MLAGEDTDSFSVIIYMQSYWNLNPNCTWDPDLSENFNCMNQIASTGGVSGA